MDPIIGYTMTEEVTLNVESGKFERVSQEPKVNPTVIDPVLLSLLQGQADLMQSLTEKVNRLSEAPKKRGGQNPPIIAEGTWSLEPAAMGDHDHLLPQMRHPEGTPAG